MSLAASDACLHMHLACACACACADLGMAAREPTAGLQPYVHPTPAAHLPHTCPTTTHLLLHTYSYTPAIRGHRSR